VEVRVLYHLDCNGGDRHFSGILVQEKEVALKLLNNDEYEAMLVRA